MRNDCESVADGRLQGRHSVVGGPVDVPLTHTPPTHPPHVEGVAVRAALGPHFLPEVGQVAGQPVLGHLGTVDRGAVLLQDVGRCCEALDG